MSDEGPDGWETYFEELYTNSPFIQANIHHEDFDYNTDLSLNETEKASILEIVKKKNLMPITIKGTKFLFIRQIEGQVVDYYHFLEKTDDENKKGLMLMNYKDDDVFFVGVFMESERGNVTNWLGKFVK